MITKDASINVKVSLIKTAQTKSFRFHYAQKNSMRVRAHIQPRCKTNVLYTWTNKAPVKIKQF